MRDLPLSVGPEELRSELDWAGTVAPLAVGLTVLAVVSNRFLDWRGGLCVALLLLAWELRMERRLSRPGVPLAGADGTGAARPSVIPPSIDH